MSQWATRRAIALLLLAVSLSPHLLCGQMSAGIGDPVELQGAPLEVTLSPDGKLLAWVESAGDASRIFVAPLHNLAHKLRITAAKTASESCREKGIRWSPDSEALAYFSECDASGNHAALYLSRLFAPPARKIAEVASTADVPQFSPDGKLVALLQPVASAPQQTALQLIPLTPGQLTKQIQLHDASILDFDWSPDSAALVLTAQSGDGATALAIYSLADATRRMIPFASPDPANPLLPFGGRWSASGRQIAFLAGNAKTPASLWLLELTATNGAAIPPARHLNPGRPTASVSLFWQADEHIFVAERAGPNAQLIRYHLAADGAVSFGSPIFSLPGSFSDGRGCLSIASDSAASLFVFSAATATHPASVYAAKPSVVMGSGIESLLPMLRSTESATGAANSAKIMANTLEIKLPWSCGKLRAERRHLDR